MKITRRVRSALTLIEMLIVIALIGIIGSALAYNMSAGLNKGKEFKNEQNKRKIRNILEYEVTHNNLDPGETAARWADIVKNSSLRDRDVPLDQITQDAYGKPYHVIYDDETDQFIVRSSRDSGY